jgi:hypothetical protein
MMPAQKENQVEDELHGSNGRSGEVCRAWA